MALKVIKPGMDSQQVIGRFEAERQALALMDHPNIARVLDAGSTESGRPYFVMDLVRGISVTEYCDRERLCTRERLELFVPICQAVQHAHQKGIVHRDIKPTNVLVTLHDGVPVPKVIDFGVAKATRGQLTEETLVTGFAQMIGTPLYMSPEQAELSGLDVDTRTDVYSLGVLLYELLTGTTPLERTQLEEAAYDEMRRIIREEEPPKPSTRISTLGDSAATIAQNRHTDSRTLTQQVSGELDWIVMKTLEKDRTRRYETASDLAKDVQRHLDDEAVEACPPSKAYRLRKFARRNKGTLMTFVVVAAALLTGTVVSLWQSNEANTARQLAHAHLLDADERREQAEANLSLALRVLDELHLQLIDEDGLFSEGHARGAAKQLSDSEQQLLRTGLGLYEKLCKENSDNPQAEFATAKAFARVGVMETALGRNQDAEAAYATAIHRLTKLTTKFPTRRDYRDELAKTYIWRTWLPWSRATVDRLQADLEKALELDPKSDTSHRQLVQLFLWDRGWSKLDRKRALQHAETAVRIGPRNPLNLACLAEVLNVQGKHERALEFAGRGIELGGAFSYLIRADILRSLGRWKEALADCDQAIPLAGEWLLPRLYKLRGGVYSHFHRYEEALADYDKATPLARESWRLPLLYKLRGGIHSRFHRYDEAIADYDEAIRLAAERELPGLYNTRGDIYSHLHRYEEALADYDRSLELDSRQGGVYKRRGYAHFQLEHYDKALADIAKAVELNPEDGSNWTWIPLSKVTACPNQQFKKGLLALADKHVERTDDRVYPYTIRGRIHVAFGQYDKALADIAKAVELKPERASNWTWIPLSEVAACANQQFKKGLLALADKHVELTDDWAYPYATRGTIHAAFGQHDEARDDFTEAIRIRPDRSVYWFQRGSAYAKLGQPEQAQADYDKGIELLSESIKKAPDDWSRWRERGVAYSKIEAWDKAMADFSKAIELDNDEAIVRYWLALAHLATGDMEGYRTACAQMLEQFGDSQDLQEANWLAWTCALGPEAIDDYSAVIRMAERAVEADAESGHYLQTLGAVLCRAGQAEQAVERLAEVERRRQEPDEAANFSPAYCWYFLAMAHHKLGHDAEAKKWLDKATEWTDKVVGQHEEGTTTLAWNRRLTLKLFREEAEAVIRNDD